MVYLSVIQTGIRHNLTIPVQLNIMLKFGMTSLFPGETELMLSTDMSVDSSQLTVIETVRAV